MDIIDDQRPWGSERIFLTNQKATVKLLFIKAGEQLSLQYHNHRDEFERVISGTPRCIIGEKTIEARVGDEFFIPKGTVHRFSAGENDVTLLEMTVGDFDENDIVRLEDDYDRTSP